MPLSDWRWAGFGLGFAAEALFQVGDALLEEKEGAQADEQEQENDACGAGAYFWGERSVFMG